MPFCEDCAKYWTPSAMRANGTCPTCGRVLEEPKIQTTVSGAQLREMAGQEAKAPWHFKLLVVAVVVYVGWRILQLVGIL